MTKLKLVISMIIFGTIGIFAKYISLSSAIIALARGIVGTLFLLLIVLISKSKISIQAIKRNLTVLVCSGAAVGINWIFLFEAYRHTTVSTATLCYYLAPVFVMALSPIVLKEKLTPVKALCVMTALVGMGFVTGIFQRNAAEAVNFSGIIFGVLAAAFYASVTLMNKFLKNISSFDSSIMQLGVATLVILPYTLLTESMASIILSVPDILLLITVGILHTGVAFHLYFSSLKDIKGQSYAVLSYIDPVVAIVLSAAILRETLSFFNIIGAALILGSTLFSELTDARHKTQ